MSDRTKAPVGKKAQAVILGGLVTAATFFALGCLVGMPLLVVFFLATFGDHRPDDGRSNVIAVVAVMAFVLGFRMSYRFGRFVGRDWYRGGQGSTR